MPCVGPCSSTCNHDAGHKGTCMRPIVRKKKVKSKKVTSKKPKFEITSFDILSEPSISEHVLLCSACRVLERTGYDFDENPSLSIWWDKHKKKDNVK